MFTPYMTNEEIQHEAYKDFLELKMKIRIAFEEFCRQQQVTKGCNILHNIVSTRNYRTKRGNTWQTLFILHGRTLDNQLIVSFTIYIPIHRNEQTEYLFLRNLDEFSPERITAHFMQRYKERYLLPNNINVKGMPSAVYFQHSTHDMQPTDFFPDNWTEEDMINKTIWISDQGLFVTYMEDKMRVFITFLDQANLSRYKTMIYEEEQLNQIYKKATEMKDEFEQIKMLNHYFNRPNARKIHERYMRRIADWDNPQCEELLQENLKYWDDLKQSTSNLLTAMDECEMSNKKNLSSFLSIKDIFARICRS